MAKTKQSTFNTFLFESFANLMRNSSGKLCGQREIPMSFEYLGVKYSKMLYQYKFNGNNASCVMFSLPKIPQNSHMSCHVVGGSDSAEEAIYSLKRFADGKYA